jgi:hypothetical protein
MRSRRLGGWRVSVGTAIAPGSSGPAVQEGVGWDYIVPKAAKNVDDAKTLVA